jgi:hypothetical protein
MPGSTFAKGHFTRSHDNLTTRIEEEAEFVSAVG